MNFPVFHVSKLQNSPSKRRRRYFVKSTKTISF